MAARAPVTAGHLVNNGDARVRAAAACPEGVRRKANRAGRLPLANLRGRHAVAPRHGVKAGARHSGGARRGVDGGQTVVGVLAAGGKDVVGAAHLAGGSTVRRRRRAGARRIGRHTGAGSLLGAHRHLCHGQAAIGIKGTGDQRIPLAGLASAAGASGRRCRAGARRRRKHPRAWPLGSTGDAIRGDGGAALGVRHAGGHGIAVTKGPGALAALGGGVRALAGRTGPSRLARPRRDTGNFHVVGRTTIVPRQTGLDAAGRRAALAAQRAGTGAPRFAPPGICAVRPSRPA